MSPFCLARRGCRMNVYWMGLLSFSGAVVLETLGQVTMKIGTRNMSPGAGGILRQILTNLWVQAAIVSFMTESIFWTWTLHLMPLIIAFPMGAICFATVALCSAHILKERITPQRWMGILLILIGVVMIGMKT